MGIDELLADFQSSFHRVVNAAIREARDQLNFQSSFHRVLENEKTALYVFYVFQSSFHRARTRVRIS